MHRLLPRRSSFDAPVVAANVLLRWLSLCVLFCLIGTAGFYLLAQLSDDVSVHRRDMNAAAYRAQLYFDHREALLNYLVDSVVASSPSMPASALPRPANGDDSEVQRLPLGTGCDGRQLTLLLSSRAERTLAEFGAQLIHVSADPDAPRQWLHGQRTPATPPPVELTASLLRAHARRAMPGTNVYWLSSDQPGGPLYLFRAADEASDPTNWLVLALAPDAVASMVNGHGIGDFLLLDGRSKPVLSSRADTGPPATWLYGQRDDAFAFVWARGLPQGLALVKSIGQDGWRLVYHVPSSLLLRDMAGHAAVSLLLCLAAVGALRLLIRRIDRQLIQPAHQQHLQLKESFDFGSTVIEMAPVGMCVLRCHDAQVMLENQLARDWLGSDTRSGDWTGAWRNASGRALCPTHRRGVDFTTRDGRQLQVLFAATRYHGDDVLLCVFNDITRHRQIQAALSAAKQAADEASQAKSAFVATMSHEIRTPLYGVLGTLELLGNTPLDSRQAQYLKTIQQSSSVLLQLISDILDVSKIESGQLTLATAAFSPLELAEDTLRAYAAAAARKQLQIVVCTDPRLPAQVTGDADRIRQVLGNLLSNAIKFTDSGRIVLRVRLLACEGGTATVSWQVTDTGIGIAAADHPRLFEPFRQAGGQGRNDGTGLGLSISDHLVRLMNGEMRLVSEPGLGSSFTVILPLGVQEGTSINAAAVDDGPALLPHPPVYVRCAITELTDSACQWLQRWGATARRYSDDAPGPIEPGAILLDSDPRDAIPVEWPGPRVVATADGGDPACEDPMHPDQLTVTLLSIRAIADAVFRLQHGNQVTVATSTPIVSAPLGLRVLVAEDNPINRLILKEQLETLGCHVATASDGHEALACCRAQPFDVVLTDINMPGLGGHALTRHLRQLGYAMPVIGATANATPDERERCLAEGMDDYLVKPIDIATLRHALGGLTAGATA